MQADPRVLRATTSTRNTRPPSSLVSPMPLNNGGIAQFLYENGLTETLAYNKRFQACRINVNSFRQGAGCVCGCHSPGQRAGFQLRFQHRSRRQRQRNVHVGHRHTILQPQLHIRCAESLVVNGLPSRPFRLQGPNGPETNCVD